jgi:hypothetical protein
MTGPRHYRLVGKQVVRADVSTEAKLLAWARDVYGDEENDSRRVALTEVAPGVTVSTVFLGLDHGFTDDGPPIVFETMAFDDYGGGDQWRYSTWEEAEAGHRRVVEQLRAKLAGAVQAARKQKGATIETKETDPKTEGRTRRAGRAARRPD